jgi:hypothetical protein
VPFIRNAWALAYFAHRDSGQALQHFEAPIDDHDAVGYVGLGQLKANIYSDPILEEPRWRDARDKVGAL